MYKSITFHTGIFNEDELDFLHEDIENVLKTNKGGELNKDWGYGVKQYSEPIKMSMLEPGDKNYNIISNKCIEILNMVPHYIYYYFWGPGSYIPWHNDYNHLSAFTIYMNKMWDHRFGGLFQYQLRGEVRTYLPLGNTGVSQIGGVDHSTTIQSSESPIRKSIQCWFDERKTKTTIL